MLPTLGGTTTQVPACTGVELVKIWQSVRWKPLPALAGVGVHEATLVGPLTNVSAGHVVVVQPLPGLAAEGLQDATATLVVLLVEQVVLVSDAAIRESQLQLWQALRLVLEPGGAAAFAALLSGAYKPSKGERVGVLLCGANTTAVDFTS